MCVSTIGYLCKHAHNHEIFAPFYTIDTFRLTECIGKLSYIVFTSLVLAESWQNPDGVNHLFQILLSTGLRQALRSNRPVYSFEYPDLVPTINRLPWPIRSKMNIGDWTSACNNHSLFRLKDHAIVLVAPPSLEWLMMDFHRIDEAAPGPQARASLLLRRNATPQQGRS